MHWGCLAKSLPTPLNRRSTAANEVDILRNRRAIRDREGSNFSCLATTLEGVQSTTPICLEVGSVQLLQVQLLLALGSGKPPECYVNDAHRQRSHCEVGQFQERPYICVVPSESHDSSMSFAQWERDRLSKLARASVLSVAAKPKMLRNDLKRWSRRVQENQNL